MKRIFFFSATAALFFLAACQKDKNEYVVQPVTEADPSVQEEAFPGQVGRVAKGLLFGEPIEYTIINNQAIFQGDIILTDEQLAESGETGGRNARVEGTGRTLQASRWPNNTVHYTIDPSLPDQQRVMNAIAHWQEHTGIRFVKRTTQTNYITFRPGSGCSSHIGMIGNQQFINLAANCSTGNTIHEIGHALGLYHEHSHSRRNSFIRINTYNALIGTEHNFDTYAEKGWDGFDLGPLDLGSIMMYGSFSFSSNGQPTITRLDGSTFPAQRSALSKGDKAIINVMYPNRSGIFAGNETWLNSAFSGTGGTYFADVSGDGKADAIIVTGSGIQVRRSNGSQFTASESWLSGTVQGKRGIFFADINADRRADLILVNDGNITVRLSTGSRFGAAESWTTSPFFGTRGTFVADVNGDGRADVVAVNDNEIAVRPSNGLKFTKKETWLSGNFQGNRGVYFADVCGDGKADAIAVNSDRILVRRSNGRQFTGTETWSTTPFAGTRSTFFAHVSGDKQADAIAVNDTNVTVRTSTGKEFLGNAPGVNSAFFGTRGTHFADVTGDGRADAIVVNDNALIVRRAAN